MLHLVGTIIFPKCIVRDEQLRFVFACYLRNQSNAALLSSDFIILLIHVSKLQLTEVTRQVITLTSIIKLYNHICFLLIPFKKNTNLFCY